MTDSEEMIGIGAETGIIGITETETLIGIVITGTKTVRIIAGANTLAQAPPADPTGTDATEIAKTTDAETPDALQTKEAATITLLALANIDHDISLKRLY